MTDGPRTLVRIEGRLGRYAQSLPRTARATLKRAGNILSLSSDHELSLVLCDGPVIHRLNRHWRGKDRPTDVLSFPLHDLKPGQSPPSGPLGDIVLSLSVARRQARSWQEPWDLHFKRLLLHSLLHLLGYDHIREQDRRIMEREERRILKLL